MMSAVTIEMRINAFLTKKFFDITSKRMKKDDICGEVLFQVKPDYELSLAIFYQKKKYWLLIHPVRDGKKDHTTTFLREFDKFISAKIIKEYMGECVHE